MKHLVNSLKFDLYCPLEAQAFELRQEVMQELQPLLIDAIEGSCKALIPGDEWLMIDKLEIDLGRISSAELKDQFGPLFRSRFEERLTEHLARLTGPEGHTEVQDQDLQLLFYFMQTGCLPWWAGDEVPDFEALCQRIIQRRPEAVTAFFHRRAKAEYIWERVLKQLDYRFWEFLLSSLEPFKEARLQFKHIAAKLEGFLKQTADPIAATVLDELHKIGQDDRILLLSHASEIFKVTHQEAIKDWLATLIAEKLFPAGEPARAALHTQVLKIIAEQEVPGKVKTDTAIREKAEQPQELELTAPDKIMIHDAGLVLLGPYLKPFFTALGLWSEQQWTSRDAQERAACLLKWIATGKKADKEYNLVLEKLLCGIPIYQPIATDFEFTEEEIKEAETLLESVIAHWQALKNTSVEGFRSSFLMRDAMLYRKEEHWQLVVEKKTLDILLENIPWGYGTLCLSWNEYLIFTEW